MITARTAFEPPSPPRSRQRCSSHGVALAVGVLGVEGDPADLMYVGVVAVGAGGAFVARFQARGMARALVAMALSQAVVAVIALIGGMHRSPVSSVAEVLGVNGMFVALFLGSAWLFQEAAREQPPAAEGEET